MKEEDKEFTTMEEITSHIGGINEFNIDDPYSRILRLFYEKSTSTFNEIFNEFKKYGNRLISLSSDFNIYIDNPNRKKSILKQVEMTISTGRVVLS